MAADRAQHVVEVIQPALEAGPTVITDRFAGSSIAYQGYGRQLRAAEVERLSRWATDGLWPDLIVLLEVSPRTRRAGWPRPKDRVESAGDAFHARVHDGFLVQAMADPDRWAIVDGTGVRGGGRRRHLGDRRRSGSPTCAESGAAPARDDAAVTTAAELDVWADVVGQDHAVAQLTAAAVHPVHSYLLVGPGGSGKRAAAACLRGAPALGGLRGRGCRAPRAARPGRDAPGPPHRGGHHRAGSHRRRRRPGRSSSRRRCRPRRAAARCSCWRTSTSSTSSAPSC